MRTMARFLVLSQTDTLFEPAPASPVNAEDAEHSLFDFDLGGMGDDSIEAGGMRSPEPPKQRLPKDILPSRMQESLGVLLALLQPDCSTEESIAVTQAALERISTCEEAPGRRQSIQYTKQQCCGSVLEQDRG